MAAGDVPGAKSEYDSLLTLWKQADPDLPVLVTAREERRRLR